MSVVKRGQRYHVYIYDPAIKRKRFFGSFATEKEAKQVFRDRTNDLQGESPTRSLTVSEYATFWLEARHGEHTKRKSPLTLRNHELALRPFLEDFGRRQIRGGITRGEALAWSGKYSHNAVVVCALFNDAFNDERTSANPFADRRQDSKRGRRDIHPITEPELDLLASLAVTVWGENYGMVVRGWILFMAWTGVRPGEAFACRWEDLDLERATVRLRRSKGRRQTESIILPTRASEALLDMPVDRSGLLFTTTQGRALSKGNSRYYFDPVRKAWQAQLSVERLEQVRGGRPAFDQYCLRHFCASFMVRQGLNEFEGSRQLGNSPEVFRETYVHPFVDATNDRIRVALEGGRVSDLDEARRRKGRA